MNNTRYAFASSLCSFLPTIAVVLFFAISDVDLYKSVTKANQGYEFLLFVSPIILILFMLYHTVVGFIQNNLKHPKLTIAISASVMAALPLPLVIVFSKTDTTSEERLAILLTAAVIFAIFWLSLVLGSFFQFFKIRKKLINGT